MKQIFLISGEAQNGKDSTALILKKHLPGKTLILHYADYLKYICSQYLGWDGQKDEVGRTLIQQVGTEKIRLGANKPTYWVDRACEIMEFFKDDFDYFIIPDARFKNEMYIPMGVFPDKVTTIRVKRLNFDNGLTEEQKNHISERDLMEFRHDYYIESESGLDNLEEKVLGMMELRRLTMAGLWG